MQNKQGLEWRRVLWQKGILPTPKGQHSLGHSMNSAQLGEKLADG